MLTYHHLVTELVIEGVWEESSDRRQPVDHIERQAAIVSEHHQQGTHVRVDLVHLDSGSLQKLKNKNKQSNTGFKTTCTWSFNNPKPLKQTLSYTLHGKLLNNGTLYSASYYSPVKSRLKKNSKPDARERPRQFFALRRCITTKFIFLSARFTPSCIDLFWQNSLEAAGKGRAHGGNPQT